MKHIKRMVTRIEVHVIEDDGYEHDDAYYAAVPGIDGDITTFSAISRADSTASGLISEVIQRYEGR
jgi:hypothetical protein